MNAKFKNFIKKIEEEQARRAIEKPECEYLLSNEHKELMRLFKENSQEPA